MYLSSELMCSTVFFRANRSVLSYLSAPRKRRGVIDQPWGGPTGKTGRMAV